ncbi:MAG: HlyD family efflux transporter periplasmic adaptor subunit [Phaeodactylibacter sp.]|nr:HlyD family efflux transporter periplasmic adaptor subunit [Phaeodactylibacter sp.]MCB9265814.1 HlyD family efflux transporter periplasmic adaptor subunit [Lewinellaceae bacterium]MCB9290953.1 HlyD family efflux transporter periplasmic adaptor subunit [Lewinellaceae bacterium]
MDRKIEKKKWTVQRIGLYTIAVAVVGFLFSAIYREAGTSRLNVQSERLLTDTVETGVFKEFITLFGVVEPISTVYLDAIESGRVEEIYIENGAMVSEGQELMRLSNLELQLNVLNQEAQIITQINTIRNTSILMDQQSLSIKEQALDVEYRIDLLEKRNARNQSLYRDSVISQVDFEETQDEYEHLLRRRVLLRQTIEKDSLFQLMQQNQMENSLDLMHRNLAIAKNSLEHLTVRAPISGQLSGMDSEVGQLINRGDRIAQIDILHDYKIRARIDEYYISRIFPEQEGTFVMDGNTYTLRIRRIYPEVSNGTFEADLVFVGDRPSNIKRGQTISLKLSLSDETQAMLLEKGGFYQATGGNWVYVIDPNSGMARKRDIRVGRQNPNYYEVIEGLNEGDVVIVSSYDNFGDKEELVLK